MTNLNQSTAAPALDEQDRPDQESAVRISLIEVSEYCRSSDLPEILGEVDHELQMARLGQGRWKEMKLDLMYGDACCVHPIDYCVDRLRALVDLGLERLIVAGAAGGPAADRTESALSRRLMVEEVLPALRP